MAYIVAQSLAINEGNKSVRAHNRVEWNELDAKVAMQTLHFLSHDFQIPETAKSRNDAHGHPSQAATA